MRSILYTWLLFFISVVGPGGKIFDMTGIPDNKSIASLYTISIVIRSLVDMVPDKANRDEPQNTQVDDFGLATRPDRLSELNACILEEKATLLEFISWTMQGTAFSATAGVILWIAFRSVKPLEKRLHLRTIHMGSIHHFRYWIHQLLLMLVYTVPTLFVVFLGCIVILACLCGILLTTSILALERLPVRRANVHRIMLYSFALSWMLAGITFYVVMYNDAGTSKAGVPEALG